MTYGFAFGATDQHLIDVIVQNGEIPRLYVGVHKPDSSDGQSVIEAAKKARSRRKKLKTSGHAKHELALTFFDSSTADVWDAVP